MTIVAFTIANVMVTVTALLSVSCVVTYQVTTGGAWRKTEVGRHLMAFMAALAAVLILGTVRQVALAWGLPDPQWFQYLRLFVFTSIPIVFAWRLEIIIKAGRDLKREKNRIDQLKFTGTAIPDNGDTE